MRAAIFLPSLDVGDEHTRTHHICQSCTGLLERAFDIADDLNGLLIAVINANDVSTLVDRGGPGQIDSSADSNRTAVSDDIFPLSPRRNVLAIWLHLSNPRAACNSMVKLDPRPN